MPIKLRLISLFKEAAKLSWRHKHLWLFGLLSFGPFGLNLISLVIKPEDLPMGGIDFPGTFDQKLEALKALTLVIGAFFALATIALLVLAALAEAAIIDRVANIRARRPTNTGMAFKAGTKHLLRMILLRFTWLPMIILGGGFLTLMVFFVLKAGYKPVGMVFYTIYNVGFIAILLWWFGQGLVVTWAKRYIVLEGQQPVEAFLNGLGLAARNLGHTLFAALLGWAIWFIYSSILTALAWPALFWWENRADSLGTNALVLISSFVSIPIAAPLFTFVGAYWTLLFMELRNREDLEARGSVPGARYLQRRARKRSS